MAKKKKVVKVTKKRVVKDPEKGTEREEEFEEEEEQDDEDGEEEEEESEPTVRMKAPAGHGATGITIGDKVIHVRPDKKGFVNAPNSCITTLRGLGYEIVHEEPES